MKKVFLDTNVILDILLRREPFIADSAAVWDLLEREKAAGYASAISFNNIHYIIRKLAGTKDAQQAMRAMRDTLYIVPLDEKTLDKAIDAKFSDFEDAIQFFSAIRCEADFLLTRNVSDFPHDDIPILKPQAFLALNLSFD